ncbi:peptidoglycan DD-metalloendopeptidase family protein [Algoriphagus sp. D3-2-R+10]|uniref:peptidoglycan DD-metalloendopeptidase family protein n=1 Tax=Algoriphagus aurantiacus TaxID=3103948 RepID=UPI002B3F2EAA|nr:peptidoglycan DD-metalloendopeptidase family protein [Algoriphagus sp. D3-2-R+10]MEB2774766.1 peptidoglycan DD-metalloendopeptidase family protein [Algoriphagus sp. D3-2-R+10]
MNWNEIDFFPVMGENLNFENTVKLDFSAENSDLDALDLGNTASFDAYVTQQIRNSGSKYGIGGYLEHRAIYRRSAVFATAEADFRNIHLGIDIWTGAGVQVYSPFLGRIHSFQDNAGFGNYGATIILEHELFGTKLYSLYGHLFLSDLENLEVGQEVSAGDLLAHIGPFPENGDWPPHLHFQLMWDLMGNVGDFPGVCSKREVGGYEANCPDPNLILRSEVIY